MDIVGLIIQLVAGVIGGNAAGRMTKSQGLGGAGNSIVGAIGGVVLGQIVERVARWAGIREAAAATGAPSWPEETEKAFAAAVAPAVRLLGDRGRGLVGAGRMPASFSDPLLVAAAAQGCRTVGGLGMLIHQAARQQRIWLGRDPDVTAMTDAALRRLRTPPVA